MAFYTPIPEPRPQLWPGREEAGRVRAVGPVPRGGEQGLAVAEQTRRFAAGDGPQHAPRLRWDPSSRRSVETSSGPIRQKRIDPLLLSRQSERLMDQPEDAPYGRQPAAVRGVVLTLAFVCEGQCSGLLIRPRRRGGR